MAGKWQELRDRAVEQERRGRLKALTQNQSLYLDAMNSAKAVICTGPAGTGKSYMACGKAAELLVAGHVKRIVISRPLLECGEEVGTLPGDLWEKVSDMLMPLTEALAEFVGAGEVKAWRDDGRLVAAPLAKLRGATLKDSFVILDEAQNATFRQLKMFLTRFGKNSRMVVCGDYTQSDLPYQGRNSLLDVVERFTPDCHEQVRIVRMGSEDIVRDELVRWFDERLSGPVLTPTYEEDWYWLECPECQTTIWVDDADQVECHLCMTPVDLWDGKTFSPRKAESRSDNCVWGLARKP